MRANGVPSPHRRSGRRRWRASLLAAVILAAPLAAIPVAAAADEGAPWDGTPISAGLGPTYGEAWCAAPAAGTSIANQQEFDGTPFGDTLALVPYEAVGCSLDQFNDEAAAAGIPPRMTWEVNAVTDAGREQLAVVVNALETADQQRDFARWQQVRDLMTTDPGAAQDLLASWGDDVKMPIFIEANIHGDEEEGADAMLQIIRDLVTTPYGDHPTVDLLLDHAILVVIPSQNPDGRFLGQRANGNSFDMNRDLLVQSQAEIRANVRLQLEWLAPVMLAMHGNVNPTLIDGLTKPHNPGLEYDIFGTWNQRRLDANVEDYAAARRSLTIPVRDYGANGGQQASVSATAGSVSQVGTTVTVTTGTHGLSVGQTIRLAGVSVYDYDGEWVVTSVPATNRFTFEHTLTGLPPAQQGVVFTGSPAVAEGWDDWGPFYTQTYGAYFGVDGSTLEMCNNATCGGRLGSKTAQYIGFYSSAEFWLTNRAEILHDQLVIAERNVTNAPRVDCCDGELGTRGFDAANHDWMVDYPEAFVIPNGTSPGGKPLAFDDGQRSQAEANRVAQWLLDNGVELQRTTKDYVYGGQTIAKHSYVVEMDQFMRGFAYTALSAGQDISDRITTLYAPPGAWSHGQLWGADTIEVPAGATFAPNTEPLTTLEAFNGGVRGGGKADWYALALRGVPESQAVLDLLRDGIDGEVAEASFTSESAGVLPAGSVLFQNTPANVTAMTAAGLEAGVWFERVLSAAKPATSQLDEAPQIAVLVNNAAPVTNDTMFSLRRIFGEDVRFVSMLNGAGSLQNAADDPLAEIDVIYNTGQAYPAASATARQRLDAFFARGGGYIGTSVSANNFTFLTGAGLVAGAFTQLNAGAAGGIARWENSGAGSPVTGAYPATDFWYLPSNVTYFSAVPTGAVVDGAYPDGASASPTGPTELFVSGLWRNRTTGNGPATVGAPVIVHGDTVVGSRYVGVATNPFSRGDFERIWPLIAGSALWSNQTDD